jgi:hypothetical protein
MDVNDCVLVPYFSDIYLSLFLSRYRWVEQKAVDDIGGEVWRRR